MEVNSEIERLVIEFLKHRYMLDMGKGKLSKWLKCTEDEVIAAKKVAKRTLIYGEEKPQVVKESNYKNIPEKKRQRSLFEYKNILVIGDTHLPYEKEGYLEFCKEQYDKYKCDGVVHIGDLIDSHATSRHPSIPDAYSAGDELQYTINKLKNWYKVFPEMMVCIGNHDVRSWKLASEFGIASKWMRGFADVLEVPNWQFEESFEINDIVYTHGTGTSGKQAAVTRALNLGQSVVIGHLHTDAGILYHKLKDKTIFGMITPVGIDEFSYGMNYAKNFPKKSIIGCGVVLGNQPILCIMN